MNKPHIISITNHIDERGEICFFETAKTIDFSIKRIYYITNVPNEKERGKHAHKKLKQLMIAVGGSVNIELDDGKKKYNFLLSSPNQALYVPCGYWRVLKFLDKNATCFVFASEEYDKEDYIFDYDEFVKSKKSLLDNRQIKKRIF